MNYDYLSLVNQTRKLFNAADLALADKLFHPQFLFYAPEFHHAQGLDSFKKWVVSLHNAYDDYRVDFDDIIVSHDEAAVQWIMTGTHNGELGSLAPTGRSLRLPGVAVLHITVNKFIRCWFYYDRLALYKQLGLLVPDGLSPV